MKNETKKIGWVTSIVLPSKRGRCNWYGCTQAPFKGGFCETHGKFTVKGTIVK